MQFETEAWKRLLERRKKMAIVRELFFNKPFTNEYPDEEEIERLAKEVVSSVLLSLVREAILPNREESRREDITEVEDKHHEKVHLSEISLNILPQLSHTCTSRSRSNESRRRLGGLLERILPCVNKKKKSED